MLGREISFCAGFNLDVVVFHGHGRWHPRPRMVDACDGCM